MRRKVPNLCRSVPKIGYHDLMQMHASEISKKYKVNARQLEQSVRFDYCDGASQSDIQSTYDKDIYNEKKRDVK